MDYIDLSGDTRDVYSKRQLESLREDLKGTGHKKGKLTGEHIYEYGAEWNNGCLVDDLAAFGERVYTDLHRIIKPQLDEAVDVDAITKEVQLHEKFQKDRLEHFTGQDEALKKIDGYLSGKTGKVFSIIGPSGSGKTSIMAKAIEGAGNKSCLTIFRFIGTTSGTSDTHRLLYQIIQQITGAYGVEMNSLLKEVEDEKKFSTVWGLKDILSRCLALASNEKPLIIFLDALDQLSQDHASLSLDWLPRELPENTKMVISALPELKEKLSHTEIYEINPMSENDGAQLLDRWLKAINRTLQKDQSEEIISKFAANGTPLYLKLTFEKARTWHSYSKSVEVKPDIEVILGEYFDELQKTHGEMLVRKFSGYMLSGKYHGLTESELLDIFVFDKEHWERFIQSSHEDHREEIKELDRLPIVVWSRLFLDLEPYLTEKDATGFPIISFYHRQFAEYAVKRYLHVDSSCRIGRHPSDSFEPAERFPTSGNDVERGQPAKYHKTLADYFETRWREPYVRALDELPWQQTKGEMWEGLEETLTDLQFIEAKCRAEMAYELVSDYDLIAAGKATAGPPIITARFHQNKYGVFCPFCFAWVEIKKDNLDRIINCAVCGSMLKVNPFVIEVVWEEMGPRIEIVTKKNIVAIEVSKAVAEFADFVRSEIHILKDSPDLTFQQAMTQPDKTAPYKAADYLWTSGRRNRSWLKWINKPQHIDSCIMTLKGHADSVLSCVISPDGKRIVSCSKDKTLKVWDMETGRQLATLVGHDASVHSCAISPDGRKVVSGSWDNTLKIWDMESGAGLATLKGHTEYVTCCAISPDGKCIVSGSGDSTLKIWDMESGAELATLKGHTDTVWSCAISPDGKRIASGSGDRTLKLWDTETRVEIAILIGHTSSVTACAFSPDGKRVSGGLYDTLQLWDTSTGEQIAILKGHAYDVNCCAFSSDGKRIVTGSLDETLKLWDAYTGEQIATLKGHIGWIRSCAFSPDGKLIISGSEDETLKLWDTNTGNEIATLKGDTINLYPISPDGKRVIFESIDQTFKLWGAGEELATLQGYDGWIHSYAFSPDGKCIVSGSTGQTLTLWNACNGKEIAILKGHTSSIGSCAFSPNGKCIVSGSKDETLKLWDAYTGDEIATLKGHTGAIDSCAFSPDSKRIVSGSKDKTLKLWDAYTGDEIATLKGHTGAIDSCAFSPDAKRIIYTCNSDRTLRVWDYEKYKEIAKFIDICPCKVVSLNRGDLIVAGGGIGIPYLLSIEGIKTGSPYINSGYLFLHDKDKYDEFPTAVCQWCDKRFTPDESILDTIRILNSHLSPILSPCHLLPDEAWDDPRLFSECPHCHKPLRFNPFIVDNRDRYTESRSQNSEDRITAQKQHSEYESQSGEQKTEFKINGPGISPKKTWWQFWKK